MKSFIRIFGLIVLINITMVIAPQPMKAQGVTVGFQVFYDDLSPYGTWVNNAEYGYVWYPNAGADFTPYGSNGYWAMTDAGWTWVSYYPWGWAPFHYGRWYDDPMFGNMWVPGNEWGPGWVCWRQSEGYYGWAPIGPGISLDMAYSNNYHVRNEDWRFVRDKDFGREHINNYYTDRATNVTIINKSKVVNNNYVEGGRKVSYNAGPDRKEAEKRAGRSFTPIPIKENTKHGENMGKGELQLYRPTVQKSNTAGKKEAPAKVATVKDLKTPAQKSSTPAKQEPAKQKPPTPPAKQEPTMTPKKNQAEHVQQVPQKTPVQPAKPEPQPAHKQEPTKQQPPANNGLPYPDPKKNTNPPNKEQPKPMQPREDRPSQPPPIKEQPKQEQPRENRPIQPPARQEPPKQETPRQEPPREEVPRQEEPRQEAPRQEAPRQEVPQPHMDEGQRLH